LHYVLKSVHASNLKVDALANFVPQHLSYVCAKFSLE